MSTPTELILNQVIATLKKHRRLEGMAPAELGQLVHDLHNDVSNATAVGVLNSIDGPRTRIEDMPAMQAALIDKLRAQGVTVRVGLGAAPHDIVGFPARQRAGGVAVKVRSARNGHEHYLTGKMGGNFATGARSEAALYSLFVARTLADKWNAKAVADRSSARYAAEVDDFPVIPVSLARGSNGN